MPLGIFNPRRVKLDAGRAFTQTMRNGWITIGGEDAK
jgi:hypothetical protein